MKAKIYKFKTEALTTCRAMVFVFSVLLAFCGSLRASDIVFEYDSINGLVETDYLNGNQIAYDNDPVGNRLSETSCLVTTNNQHLTIQYKVLVSAPLQYSAEVSTDQNNWFADNVSVIVAPFNSQYNLVTATDLTAMNGTDPRYIRLDTYPTSSGSGGSPGIDAPLLPFWAAVILAIVLLSAGFGVLKSRGNHIPV